MLNRINPLIDLKFNSILARLARDILTRLTREKREIYIHLSFIASYKGS